MRKTLKKIKNDSDRRLLRRRLSIRTKIVGSAECPRICLTKSNKNFFVQVIDDSSSVTLASVQTFGKNAVAGSSKSVDGVVILGKALAAKMKDQKLVNAVFDRSGRKYTGLISKFVETVREEGIKI